MDIGFLAPKKRIWDMNNKLDSSTAFGIAANEQSTTNAHSLDISNLVYELKRAHMKSDELYVYCSENDQPLIERVLADYPFDLHFNVTELSLLKGKTLVHYKNGDLSDELAAILVLATKYGAYVEPLISYLDRRFGRTEVKLLHSGYFLHMKSFSILSRPSHRIVKRALDLLSAAALSLVAIPIGLLAALAIKLESPGPIFYRQARIGLFNQEFDVIKFRSMRNDAEKNGARWASKNDARVTRVGRFIRKTRIDELPQLINVFKGEMSLVGPRPERDVFIKNLETVIPYYRFRHAVKPGITGLAQVKYPYGASVEDAVWKHKYDIYYIKHQNLLLDIKILMLTIKTVVLGMGR